jgi:hypothetical protein
MTRSSTSSRTCRPDVLLRVLALEKQELGDHEIGVQVVDLSVDEDDPVLEEPGMTMGTRSMSFSSMKAHT